MTNTNEIDTNKLAEIFGERCVFENLKPPSRVSQNRKRPAVKQQPEVYKIKTLSGRLFKLLQVPVENNVHFSGLIDNIETINQFDFSPDVFYQDSCMLIVSYIEGDDADFSSTHFCEQYARNLAKLHQTGCSHICQQEALDFLFEKLNELVRSKKINTKQSLNLQEKLSEICPETVPKSYTYADITEQNFINASDGKLYFIDIGSFQSNQFTDFFLLSSSVYKNLDTTKFRESYISNGGSNYIFENRVFLELMSKILRSANAIKSLPSISFFDFRKKRSRKKMIDRLVSEIIP